MRKKTVAGKAPHGGSPSAGSGQGTQGPDTAADPGRCDFGKGDARGAGDGVVRPRKLSLAEAVTILFLRWRASGKPGAFLFCTRRAHLLTTPKGQWYLPLASRALSEGDCGCCGSLQTMPQHLRVLLSSSVQTANSLRQAQRIGAEILYPMLPPACANLPPAALPQRWTGVLPAHFLFAKEKQKKETR